MPVAVTQSDVLLPEQIEVQVGSDVITGELPIVSVAVELVIVPQELLTTTS